MKEKNEKQLTREREEYAAYAHRKADERGAKFGDSGAARCHAVPVKKKWKGRSESGEMILHELRVLRPIDERASNYPHALRSESDTLSALLPFFLSSPCMGEKGRRVRPKNSRRNEKNAPFRSESLRENQKTGERIHEKKIFKFTSLAISQNISTFACRLLSKCLKRVHGRVLIAEFHWPKIGG